jgi:tetratricopeptide (TPR) repeat protein
LRGLLALEQGLLRKAISEAERAVVLDPQCAVGYYVRGRVRLERGTNGALADLEKAVVLGERKDAVALNWLAAALFQAGRRTEAVAAQREAVKLKPGDEQLADQLREWETASAGQGP